jgi:hypothetical protein
MSERKSYKSKFPRDKQLDDLIAVLTRIAKIHEQAEKRRNKADERIDQIIGQALPALLAQLGLKTEPEKKTKAKPKPDYLRPV